MPALPDAGQTKHVFWWERRQAPYFELDGAGIVRGVDPALPGGAPTVMGSRLTHINGTSLAEMTDPVAVLRSNVSTLALTLEPSDGAQKRLELVIVRLDWRVQLTLLVVGVLIGGLGFRVYRVKPDIASSWGFLAFCLAVSLFWIYRSVPYHYRWPIESQAFYVLQCSMPLASLAFLGTFSPLRVVMTSLKPWLWGAAGLGVVLLAINRALYPLDAADGVLGIPLFLGWVGIMLAIIVVSQQTKLWFRLRGLAIGSTDRQRAVVLRLAAVLGFVPLAAFYVAVIAQRIDFGHRLWFELAVIAFPLIVAYAIVRHNLLQLNELAREGIAAGLLLLGVGLVYAAAAAAVGPLTERLLGGGSGVAQGLLVGASVLGLAPLYARTRHRLLIRFHRADHLEDYLLRLGDLGDEQTNLDDFCDEAVLLTSSALDGAETSLLFRQTSTETWRGAASTADPPSAIDFERCGPLLRLLVHAKAPLHQDELLEGRRFGGRRRALLEAWGELNAVMIIPLRSRDRLVGALVVGPKPRGANFTANELRFADSLRARIATGLGRWFTPATEEASTITGQYPAYPASIGHYRVDRLLGEGAMCYVYVANDDDREVAIKVPKPATKADDLRLERFLRESRVMKRIAHPHIVEVLDDGISHGEPFIVVEYFPGGSLDRYLRRHRSIVEAQALSWVRDLSGGLEAALELGIVHRDIKPANVFLAPTDRIKIGDFGIARASDEPTLTEPGSILGSPAYISPELARGRKATWKSDQYSLGICLFELIAGDRPFTADTLEGLLHLQMSEPLPNLSQRCAVSKETLSILARMTDKEPGQRFDSYQELGQALTASIEANQGRPTSTP